MVGADLQCLISSHDQSRLTVLLVLQESNITSPALLPLIGLLVELEELCAHLEGLFFEFFVGFDLNLLCEADNRFKVDIF